MKNALHETLDSFGFSAPYVHSSNGDGITISGMDIEETTARIRFTKKIEFKRLRLNKVSRIIDLDTCRVKGGYSKGHPTTIVEARVLLMEVPHNEFETLITEALEAIRSDLETAISISEEA